MLKLFFLSRAKSKREITLGYGEEEGRTCPLPKILHKVLSTEL